MKLTKNAFRKRTEAFKEKPWLGRLFPIVFGNAAVEGLRRQESLYEKL